MSPPSYGGTPLVGEGWSAGALTAGLSYRGRAERAMRRLAEMRSLTESGSRWRAVALATCLVAGIAACNSGANSNSSTSQPATSPPATAATSAAPATSTSPATTTSSGEVTNFPQYVGGSGQANPSLSPVTIGWVNEQG